MDYFVLSWCGHPHFLQVVFATLDICSSRFGEPVETRMLCKSQALLLTWHSRKNNLYNGVHLSIILSLVLEMCTYLYVCDLVHCILILCSMTKIRASSSPCPCLACGPVAAVRAALCATAGSLAETWTWGAGPVQLCAWCASPAPQEHGLTTWPAAGQGAARVKSWHFRKLLSAARCPSPNK